MRDRVDAVSTGGNALTLRTAPLRQPVRLRRPSRPSTDHPLTCHRGTPHELPARPFRPNATSKNLEVIGNNIANANTFGAKAARAEFADVYATALNGAGTNTVGIGCTLAAVAQQFTQGNIIDHRATRWTWRSTAPASSR